ncbi:MAG: aminotransferase [Pseudomonadota bacterium]
MNAPAINPAIATMDVPPIPLVQSWARAYDGRAGALRDLSQAVPGYPPHPDLLDHLSKLAASPDLAGYGDIEGEPALRAAFAASQSEQLGVSLTADSIQITSGCNQAFVVAMLTLAGAGSRVLLSDPCFFNNASALEMLGMTPVTFPCDPARGFQPDADVVWHAIETHRPAVVALVSPNNPTGAIYDAATLDEIVAGCREAGVWLVLDETYADFILSCNAPRHTLLRDPDWAQSVVLLYSFSKVYCTPGLRIGALTAGADVIAETAKVVDNLQICAPRHAQAALAHAVPELGSWRASNTEEIARRADAFRATLSQAPGWEITALGAYFAWVRHPFGERSSVEVAEMLATQRGLVVIPGEFFGAGQTRYLRFAFANVTEAELADVGLRLAALSKTG